jgi:DNA-binding MarR family transcriptional regulator
LLAQPIIVGIATNCNNGSHAFLVLAETTPDKTLNNMTHLKPSILNLERFFPYRISILSNRLSAIIAQTYKNKFALSITEWRIMAVLGEYAGSSAEEVSIKTQVEKSIVSRSISKLLNRQLVSRTVDTTDRRRQNLTLTETGEDIYSQIVPVSYAYEDRLLECFTAQERAIFDGFVDRLYQHAAKIDSE